MPYNTILDKKFSDEQGTSTDAGSASVLTYSATGGEYSFQDDRLINAAILLVFRDGLNYELTLISFTGLDKEFQFDATTGTVTFPPDPYPALQPAEKVTVLYIATGNQIIVTEPVTLLEAKNWIKTLVTDDDVLINMLITDAREDCEDYAGMSFIERTVTVIVKNDLGNVRLPYGPVGAIVSMSDGDGAAITDYVTSGESFKCITSPRTNNDERIKVVYTAGYSVLPKKFKVAILMQIAWRYQHRGDAEINISPESEKKLSKYKVRV